MHQTLRPSTHACAMQQGIRNCGMLFQATLKVDMTLVPYLMPKAIGVVPRRAALHGMSNGALQSVVNARF